MNFKLRSLQGLKAKKFWRLFLATVLIILVGYIPVRIAIARTQVPEPQAILVLGGSPNRMTFAATFWQEHPQMEIWLSGVGTDSPFHKQTFRAAGVPDDRLHFETQSTDTVTNFTYTLDEFVQENIHHVYLITSDYHIARSRAIATLIFGSRGIVVTPVSVSTPGFPPESRWRIIRDCLRCVLWLFTGRSLASLNPDLP